MCSSQDTRTGTETAASSTGTDKFHGTLVDPPLAPAPVTLRNTDCKLVRLDRRQPDTGTALFLGFINCHDVCPTTMADSVRDL